MNQHRVSERNETTYRRESLFVKWFLPCLQVWVPYPRPKMVSLGWVIYVWQGIFVLKKKLTTLDKTMLIQLTQLTYVVLKLNCVKMKAHSKRGGGGGQHTPNVYNVPLSLLNKINKRVIIVLNPLQHYSYTEACLFKVSYLSNSHWLTVGYLTIS